MRKILVLTDFSERAKHAAEFALHLAGEYQADLLLFNIFFVPPLVPAEAGVYPDYYGQAEEYQKGSMNHLESLANHLENVKIKCGVDGPRINVENKGGVFADEFKDILHSNHFWMIAMGDKGKNGFWSYLFSGSESYEVLKRANCPVLMLSEQSVFSPMRRIVFAVEEFDFETKNALRFLIDLSSFNSCEISIVHVSSKMLTWQEEQQRLLNSQFIRAEFGYDQLTFHEIKSGNISESLVAFAEAAKSDMIAVVHEKRVFFDESVSKAMMKHHTLPLLIFPVPFTKERR